jgi:hypothetical protein
MTDPEQAFEQEVEILRTEAEEAARCLYTYLAIHSTAAQHPGVKRLLESQPRFWNTILGALQTSAFIALGRVFDDDKRKRSHCIFRLLSLAGDNPQIFALDALAARGQKNNSRLDWSDFMADAYAPVPAEFEWLQQKVDEHKAIYSERYKTLRNKIVAHTDIESNTIADKLFAQTNTDEWRTLILFPQAVHDALWQLYHNGMKPVLRHHPLSVRKPISVGQQVPAHERVVHETAHFLLTAAKETS